MSVLVKGMKMPGNCEECSLKQYDEGYGDTVCPFSGIPTINIGRQVDCPIEEVPEPHGVLIDRDAHIDDMQNHLWDWDSVNGIETKTALKQAISDLRNAPIVIRKEK